VITVYLYLLDRTPDYALWVLAGSISIFWLFPLALLLTGWFTFLALASVQNLIFAILWGCYNYGGVSSPFLPWLLTVPLLAFFYLGPAPRPRLMVLAIIAVNLGVFYLVYAQGHAFPQHIPLSQLSGIGILSTLSAAIYVSMMALYYANIVASQSELEREVQRHLVTARQLREARVEAERASKAKSEFLAKMSHELRTPLNAVIGYSEMLLETAEDTGKRDQVDDLKKINGAGKHLLALVTDVLDLSKLEAGKMDVFPEKFSLPAFIAEVLATCHAGVTANRNQLVVDCPEDVGMVELDASKLRQAIVNLVSNAGKFTRDGTVTVTVRVQDRWVTIAVRDTGVGIKQENLANLFQNFVEAQESTSSKYGGTGLGLALSQKLCRLMEGDITVESVVGKGSCFTITVPVSIRKEGDEQGAVVSTGSAAARSDRHEKILVVDNDPAIVDLVQRLLKKAGYSTIATLNGAEALELAERENPAAIILDIFMPEVDGWEILRGLKAHERLGSIPVILLTVSDDLQKGRSLGASAHLVKPVDRDVLLRQIDRLLAGDDSRELSAITPSASA
jgi:signal transduction histidine kinase/ActR/RegA family two-component response regulator